MDKVYVTTARDWDEDAPNLDVWTLSDHPDYTGWETDNGNPYYGLSKELADEYAKRINAFPILVQALKEIMEVDGYLYCGGCKESEQIAREALRKALVNE